MSIMSLVLLGTGTGALNKRNIHVSISLISHATNGEICSVELDALEPVKMPQTVSRWTPREPILPRELDWKLDDGEPSLEANERA